MRTLFLGLCVMIAFGTSLGAVEPPKKLSVDLEGKGQSQTFTLEVQQTQPDVPFVGGTLRFGEKKIDLGAGFEGFSGGLEAFQVTGDKKARVLVVSCIGANDYQVRQLFAMVNGSLQRVGEISGQGEMIIPGNNTLIAKSWMGFWMKTEKHVFGKGLAITVLPQEFYSVDVTGTVLATFPVYQTREAKTVLANTRLGSMFQVLLWDPASRSEGDQYAISERDWFLIRTESGFTGWVKGEHLQYDFAELPWAG